MVMVKCTTCGHSADVRYRDRDWKCSRCGQPLRDTPRPGDRFVNGRFAAPIRLACASEAPSEHGIYEIGYQEQGRFVPMYLGRAWKTTLRERLSRHSVNSHVPEIRANVPKLYCHWITSTLAKALESHLFKTWDYPWNSRIEWGPGDM